MNILIIYPHGNALNYRGGTEARIYSLIKSLANKKYNIFILHSSKSKGYEDKKLKKVCKIFYYKELFLFGIPDWHFSDFNPFFIYKLFKILRKQKIDIIQIIHPWGFLITYLLSNKRSFLIYDAQNVEAKFIKILTKHPKFPILLKPFLIKYAKLYEKLVCKLANVIIYLNELDRNYYIKNYKIDKNKTILIQTPSLISPIGKLKEQRLKIENRIKLNLPKDKFIIVFHGSLPHPANQEAFDIIERYIAPNITNPDILFLLAGYNLTKFKKDNIISLGYVNELSDLLYSADLAIMPIISGTGMRTKCIDYIMTGLPFISTKKGIEGLHFLKAGEDCLVYNTINEDFLKGINSLFENKQLLQNFQQKILKKSKLYNWQKFEKRIIRLYNKLINLNDNNSKV